MPFILAVSDSILFQMIVKQNTFGNNTLLKTNGSFQTVRNFLSYT